MDPRRLGVRIFPMLVVALAVGLLCVVCWSIVTPLFLAAVVAGTLHPLTARVARAMKGRKTLAAMLVTRSKAPWARAGVECNAARQSINAGAIRRRGVPIRNSSPPPKMRGRAICLVYAFAGSLYRRSTFAGRLRWDRPSAFVPSL